jgi:hypothetical protein
LAGAAFFAGAAFLAGAAFFAVAITISLIKLQRAPRRSIQRGDSPASCECRMPWHVGASWARRMVTQACTPFLRAVHQYLQ